MKKIAIIAIAIVVTILSIIPFTAAIADERPAITTAEGDIVLKMIAWRDREEVYTVSFFFHVSRLQEVEEKEMYDLDLAGGKIVLKFQPDFMKTHGENEVIFSSGKEDAYTWDTSVDQITVVTSRQVAWSYR